MIIEYGQEKPVVTIIGMAGFVGSWTTLMLIKDGGFRVRGTIRQKNAESKLAPLREAFGDYLDQIELVEASLADE